MTMEIGSSKDIAQISKPVAPANQLDLHHRQRSTELLSRRVAPMPYHPPLTRLHAPALPQQILTLISINKCDYPPFLFDVRTGHHFSLANLWPDFLPCRHERSNLPPRRS